MNLTRDELTTIGSEDLGSSASISFSFFNYTSIYLYLFYTKFKQNALLHSCRIPLNAAA